MVFLLIPGKEWVIANRLRGETELHHRIVPLVSENDPGISPIYQPEAMADIGDSDVVFALAQLTGILFVQLFQSLRGEARSIITDGDALPGLSVLGSGANADSDGEGLLIPGMLDAVFHKGQYRHGKHRIIQAVRLDVAEQFNGRTHETQQIHITLNRLQLLPQRDILPVILENVAQIAAHQDNHFLYFLVLVERCHGTDVFQAVQIEVGTNLELEMLLLVLMENQIEAAEKMGLRCDVLNSTTKDRRADILQALEQDELDLILVTPETLFTDEVQAKLKNIRIGLFVIDEAHCISDWGHDFRLEYGRLKAIIGQLPAAVPIREDWDGEIPAQATQTGQEEVFEQASLFDI